MPKSDVPGMLCHVSVRYYLWIEIKAAAVSLMNIRSSWPPTCPTSTPLLILFRTSGIRCVMPCKMLLKILWVGKCAANLIGMLRAGRLLILLSLIVIIAIVTGSIMVDDLKSTASLRRLVTRPGLLFARLRISGFVC